MAFGGAGSSRADEGMWLFNRPPTELLKTKYNFEPKPEWFDHIQRSCVRLSDGGSGSIVSPDGLVMTNHHVGLDQLERLSTPEKNLLKTGFYAKTRDEELKCNDLEINVLWSIEDVTGRVNEAITASMSPAEGNTARQKKIAEITKAAEEKTGFDCQVVTLYHGARYHLYSYKRYTDIRLVMAPEGDIAHFGGDTDNFEYPRFCLDMCFFRIYENEKPIKAEHYLKWSEKGAENGELVFVAGHPGRTQRLYTVDHLKFLRDTAYPFMLNALWRREVQLLGFSARNDENARIASGDLQGVQNSRKAYTGILAGLHDPEIMKQKTDAEKKLRAAIAANPDHAAQWGDAWDKVAATEKTYESFYERYATLEGRASSGGSDLYRIARNLVRLAEELPKPDGDRLREFHDADLDSLYLRLYSPAPIYDSLEIDRLSSYFALIAERFGADDSIVTRILAGKSPRDRAVELVKGTKLKDVAVRKQLAEGGKDAIAKSNDPLIRLAYDIDPEARAVRKRYEDEVESVEKLSYAKIGAARFATYGENEYPDATFSLRLTFGEIKGFQEDGAQVPAFTDFAGLYERHKQRGGVEPFELPQRWVDAKDKLKLDTPFNFICTCDVIGGNSGSPVFNRRGEVVGLVFDGNLTSLVWNTAFTDRVARTVAVDSRAIIETMKKVSGAEALAKEIVGK